MYNRLDGHNSHEEQFIACKAGFSGRAGTVSVRNDYWGPWDDCRDDRHFAATPRVSDPVHVV